MNKTGEKIILPVLFIILRVLGDFMGNLIEVENDCFDICKRLKVVDGSYKVFFNIKKLCYEVHSFLQTQSSFCFTVPYSELDERTIDYAVKTRSENRDRIIEEIEENNRRVEERNLKMQVNALKELICR